MGTFPFDAISCKQQIADIWQIKPLATWAEQWCEHRSKGVVNVDILRTIQPTQWTSELRARTSKAGCFLAVYRRVTLIHFAPRALIRTRNHGSFFDWAKRQGMKRILHRENRVIYPESNDSPIEWWTDDQHHCQLILYLIPSFRPRTASSLLPTRVLDWPFFLVNRVPDSNEQPLLKVRVIRGTFLCYSILKLLKFL